MGIWVRSQAKKALCKVQRIYVYEKDGKWKVVNIINGESDDFDTLGTYETEEKALEVLNEIQSHIEIVLRNHEAYVFEMPKSN